MTIKIVTLGASGYTGADLIRLLVNHPQAEIVALTGDRNSGKPINQVYPHLDYYNLPNLIHADEVKFEQCDLVFCCLPHATSQAIIKRIPQSIRVIDLSADFRLRDAKVYEEWYGKAHTAPELQQEAVYGLTEHYRNAIQGARIIACPGCFPTAALLALIPIIKADMIEKMPITIDAKTGVSGAGRSLKENLLFCERAEGFQPYALGHHRHMPEIEQELVAASNEDDKDLKISFTPHLLPTNRGELLTIYVEHKNGTSSDDLRNRLLAEYENEAFVHVIEKGGYIPSSHHVRGSNHALIAVYEDRIPGRSIIVSVIDNLVKGSSGQAIQNMNIMFGLDETAGLKQLPLFP